ncbi:hypothetical protein LSTR_LSTR016448 [Laodelphax striatellus]|uniref:Uncharacterized protein n=1 Tax=Laodelphax striatellus TaxID=195883 RepID=A0A482WJU8_LAOST|nr:hypothetical protein LSTR_LSTR016448 [Laodelphax striatellus]
MSGESSLSVVVDKPTDSLFLRKFPIVTRGVVAGEKHEEATRKSHQRLLDHERDPRIVGGFSAIAVVTEAANRLGHAILENLEKGGKPVFPHFTPPHHHKPIITPS